MFITNTYRIILVGFCILAVTNCISFALMGYDKRSARKHQWRISEKTLFIACACFGALGAVLGMKLFRHKTQHWYFNVFFPLMLAVQAVLIATGLYFLCR